MELEELKKQVEKLGYTVSHRKGDDFFKAGVKGEPDSELGINTLQKIFIIRIEDNKPKIKYSYQQLYKEKLFESLEKMIEFIKSKFPLNSETS